jgi:hypothetical protein
MTTRTDAQLVIKRNVWKRLSAPTAPDAPHEMKPTSNCANHLCHGGGEPREPVLPLNAVKGKDDVVGVRLFPVRASGDFARQGFPSACFTFALLGGFRRPQCQASPNGAQ